MLKEHLDKFIIVYLDNIIIYFNTKKEYKEYVKWVLRKLYKENIPVIIKKCEFYIKKTDFVEFIIKPRQISMEIFLNSSVFLLSHLYNLSFFIILVNNSVSFNYFIMNFL